MLKRRIVFSFLLFFIVLVGCQQDSSERKLTESTYGDLSQDVKEQQANISIHIKEASYALPVTELTVILENNGEVAVGYENAVYLDKWQDGTWMEVPFSEEMKFSMEAFELKPGESFE